MKTVLFYDPNLNERGTSIAVYDYAHYNETILGNKSIIAAPKTAEMTSLDKFSARFPVHIIDKFTDLSKIPAEYLHILKYGFNDGNILPNIKNLVHVVFPSNDPHGDVYAYISKWLANSIKEGSPYVPHMISLPDSNLDYKETFSIQDEIVIGWYGGNNFEIPFARQAVMDIAKVRKDIKFLFMNQDPFCNLENIYFVDPTTDLEEKVAFINTCDAMIHARERGETFGLAIAEFSSKNKPVITYFNSPERNHIETLKDKGLYYTDYNSLYNLLLNLDKNNLKDKEWNAYQEYTPENVMNQFNNTFLWT
jgi:hypothetical protein